METFDLDAFSSPSLRTPRTDSEKNENDSSRDAMEDEFRPCLSSTGASEAGENSLEEDIYQSIRLKLGIDHAEKTVLAAMKEYKKYVQNKLQNCLRFPNKCYMLSRSVTKTLLFFKSLNTFIIDTHEYLLKLCELLSIYTTLELRYSTKFEESKTAVANRISLNYDTHIKALDEKYILKILLSIKNFYQQKEIMRKLFQKYLKLKGPNTMQKELEDKVYVMYLIAFKYWKSIEDDVDEQLKIENIANSFMRPSPTLRKNLLYAPFIPAFKSNDKEATKLILAQNFSVKSLMKAVEQNEYTFPIVQDPITNIIDLCVSEDSDIRQDSSCRTIKFPELKLEKPEVIATVDLTTNVRIETNDLLWLDSLVEKVRSTHIGRHCATVTEIIVLDDDDDENVVPMDQSIQESDAHMQSPSNVPSIVDEGENGNLPRITSVHEHQEVVKTKNEDMSATDLENTNEDTLMRTPPLVPNEDITGNENSISTYQAEEFTNKSQEESKSPERKEDPVTTNSETELVEKLVDSESLLLNKDELCCDEIIREAVQNIQLVCTSDVTIGHDESVASDKNIAEESQSRGNGILEHKVEETIGASGKESSFSEANRSADMFEQDESFNNSNVVNKMHGPQRDFINPDFENNAIEDASCTTSSDKSTSQAESSTANDNYVLCSDEHAKEKMNIDSQQETVSNPENSTDVKTHLSGSIIDPSAVDKPLPHEASNVENICLESSQSDECKINNSEDEDEPTVHHSYKNLRTYSNRFRKPRKLPSPVDSSITYTSSSSIDPIKNTDNDDKTAMITKTEESASVLNKELPDKTPSSGIIEPPNDTAPLEFTAANVSENKEEESVNVKVSEKTEEESLSVNVTETSNNPPNTMQDNDNCTNSIYPEKVLTDIAFENAEKLLEELEEDDAVKKVVEQISLNLKESVKKKQNNYMNVNRIPIVQPTSLLDLPVFSSSDENEDSAESNILSILEESDNTEEENSDLALKRKRCDDTPVHKISSNLDLGNVKNQPSNNIVFSVNGNSRPLLPPIESIESKPRTIQSNVVFSTTKNMKHNWKDIDETNIFVNHHEITSPPMELFTKSDRNLFKTLLRPKGTSEVAKNKESDFSSILESDVISSDNVGAELSSVTKLNNLDAIAGRNTDTETINCLLNIQKRKKVSFLDIEIEKQQNERRQPNKMTSSFPQNISQLPNLSGQECWTAAINTYHSNTQPNSSTSLYPPSVSTINTKSKQHSSLLSDPGTDNNTLYSNTIDADNKLFCACICLDRVDESHKVNNTNKRNTRQETMAKNNELVKKNLSDFDRYLQQKRTDLNKQTLPVVDRRSQNYRKVRDYTRIGQSPRSTQRSPDKTKKRKVQTKIDVSYVKKCVVRLADIANDSKYKNYFKANNSKNKHDNNDLMKMKNLKLQIKPNNFSQLQLEKEHVENRHASKSPYPETIVSIYKNSKHDKTPKLRNNANTKTQQVYNVNYIAGESKSRKRNRTALEEIDLPVKSARRRNSLHTDKLVSEYVTSSISTKYSVSTLAGIQKVFVQGQSNGSNFPNLGYCINSYGKLFGGDPLEGNVTNLSTNLYQGKDKITIRNTILSKKRRHESAVSAVSKKHPDIDDNQVTSTQDTNIFSSAPSLVTSTTNASSEVDIQNNHIDTTLNEFESSERVCLREENERSNSCKTNSLKKRRKLPQFSDNVSVKEEDLQYIDSLKIQEDNKDLISDSVSSAIQCNSYPSTPMLSIANFEKNGLFHATPQ